MKRTRHAEGISSNGGGGGDSSTKLPDADGADSDSADLPHAPGSKRQRARSSDHRQPPPPPPPPAHNPHAAIADAIAAWAVLQPPPPPPAAAAAAAPASTPPAAAAAAAAAGAGVGASSSGAAGAVAAAGAAVAAAARTDAGAAVTAAVRQVMALRDALFARATAGEAVNAPEDACAKLLVGLQRVSNDLRVWHDLERLCPGLMRRAHVWGAFFATHRAAHGLVHAATFRVRPTAAAAAAAIAATDSSSSPSGDGDGVQVTVHRILSACPRPKPHAFATDRAAWMIPDGCPLERVRIAVQSVRSDERACRRLPDDADSAHAAAMDVPECDAYAHDFIAECLPALAATGDDKPNRPTSDDDPDRAFWLLDIESHPTDAPALHATDGARALWALRTALGLPLLCNPSACDGDGAGAGSSDDVGVPSNAAIVRALMEWQCDSKSVQLADMRVPDALVPGETKLVFVRTAHDRLHFVPPDVVQLISAYIADDWTAAD